MGPLAGLLAAMGWRGGGWSSLRGHPKIPKFGKYSLLSLKRDDDHCRGFIGSSRDLICVNKNCQILAHSKPSSKWVQQERLIFLHPAVKAAKSRTAFVLPDVLLSGDDLPAEVLLTATEDQKTPKQWIADFMPYARIRARGNGLAGGRRGG